MRPGYHVPMHPGMPPQYYGPMQGRQVTHPMMMGRAPQMRQRGGGLLSKLLGNGKSAGVRNGMNAMSPFGVQNTRGGGSLLQTMTNPASINGFLTNTQKILNTAQQVGPMVQQYGPLVKNLPMMWKLYRGLKDAPNTTAEDETANENVESTSKLTKTGNKNVNRDDEPPKSSKHNRTSPAPSIPKLYI